MSERTLLEIFENLKNMSGRNLNTPSSLPETLKNKEQRISFAPCKCSECSDAIFVEKQRNKLVFSVCPSCNPRLTCEFCLGSGYHGLLGNKSDPVDPEGCSCLEAERTAERLNAAQIPEKYLMAGFDELDKGHLNTQQCARIDGNIEQILDFCHALGTLETGEEREEARYFLTLFGPVGTGKTLMAVAALKLFICEYKKSGRFIDFQFLLSQLKAEYDKKQSGEALMHILRNVDVLVIDEFGKGRNENEWQLEKLDDLVNYRYMNQKITLITTNYLPHHVKLDDKERQKNLQGLAFGARDEGKKTTSTAEVKSSINESFWKETLLERIGARMYERILEVSAFVDFMELTSYRRYKAARFLEEYQKF